MHCELIMRIDKKVVNKTLYIGLSGELDEHSSIYTRQTLDKLIEDAEVKRVVIDMSELSFMDSTGVGVLIGRFKRFKSRDIPIYIANPSKQADKIFKMTGIYEIMPKIS